MQYENVFKSDGLFMLYLPSSYCSYYSNCSEDGSWYWYWGSSDGSTSTHEHMAKTMHNINIHANNNKN